MSEQPELSAALKLGKVEQLSREERVLIVLTQQKLIDKLQAELEKLKDRQPTNSFHIIETPIERSDTEIRDSPPRELKSIRNRTQASTRRTGGTYRQNPQRIWASRSV